MAVMHCVVHEVPRSIRETNEDIPVWLCEIDMSDAAELDSLMDAAAYLELTEG